jgi:sn-glycerol 3-phosphate transport system substrate-binding protein
VTVVTFRIKYKILQKPELLIMSLQRTFLSAIAALSLNIGVARAQTEIQWWHAMGGQLGEATQELAQAFNKSQKEYKVNAIYKGTYTEAAYFAGI